MALTHAQSEPASETRDSWMWWEARRPRYNLALALAGWIAYGLAVGLNYAFGHPVWRDARGALGMTLFLGVVYLIVMGAANVGYLVGPTIESAIRPADPAHFRLRAFRMGLWGSLLVPASFPLVQLALLISKS